MAKKIGYHFDIDVKNGSLLAILARFERATFRLGEQKMPVFASTVEYSEVLQFVVIL